MTTLRNMNFKWSSEAAQDIAAFHGIDTRILMEINDFIEALVRRFPTAPVHSRSILQAGDLVQWLRDRVWLVVAVDELEYEFLLQEEGETHKVSKTYMNVALEKGLVKVMNREI